MVNNFEKFISSEIVVKLSDESDIVNFFSLMEYVGFSSIEEKSICEVIDYEINDLVVQYLPNFGFRFKSLKEIQAELEDMITNNVQVITLDHLFNVSVPSVA